MTIASARTARKLALVLALWTISVGFPGPIAAQEPSKTPGAFQSLDELNASYRRDFLDLERRRIADLSRLSARVKGADADPVFLGLFRAAIDADLCAEAAPAAERCLASEEAGGEARALATFVKILASADKGEFDRSFAELTAFLKAGGAAAKADPEIASGIAEAYLQRLLRSGRYDEARKLCAFACESPDAPPAMKAHFEARMDRIKLLGQAAPAIEGTDADGEKVALAGFRGKVVLIDFWATWCPPNVAAIPRLNALAEKYKGQGFEIFGVNVDALHEDVGDAKKALPVVRRFLVSQGMSWTGVIAGKDAARLLKTYGVTHIPASLLVDRDGKVIAIDVPIDGLEPAIRKALQR